MKVITMLHYNNILYLEKLKYIKILKQEKKQLIFINKFMILRIYKLKCHNIKKDQNNNVNFY